MLAKNDVKTFYISDELDRLPEKPPYGFIITPDGKYVVVRVIWGHIDIFNTLIPGITSENWEYRPLNLGWITSSYGVEFNATTYEVGADPGIKYWCSSRVTRKAMVMLKDIAEWYSLPLYKMQNHSKVI